MIKIFAVIWTIILALLLITSEKNRKKYRYTNIEKETHFMILSIICALALFALLVVLIKILF